VVSHCIGLLGAVILKSAVSWLKREQTSMQRPTSLPPLIVMIILRSKIPFLFLTCFCPSGWQALHNSACRGYFEICRFLVEARADVQAKANESAPPYRDDSFYAAKFRFPF
jgi:hypothetical protein